MGPCLVDATIANFTTAGMLGLAPVYLVHTLHQSPAVIGVLLGAGGAAGLVASLLTPRLFTQVGSARASIWAGLLAVVALICVPLAPSAVAVATFGVGYALWQATISVRSVAYFTHRQLTAPTRLLPRVLGTARFISWGMMPFGALTTGAVASLASPRAALWVTAAITLVGPLFLLTTGVRGLRNLTDSPRTITDPHPAPS
jgi:predicted MFS family arabinose efflux permease